MLSVLFYLFLFVICTFFLVLSAVALLLTWPFDKSRRIVHELSRILVRIFYAVPPLWKFRVTGREYIDRRKPYVIVVNHQAGLDIPTLYFVPLNFRWVSKREVFKVPFFGQFLLLHGDICINRSHATAAMEKVIRDGKLWLSRGASVAILSEGTRSHDGAPTFQGRGFHAGPRGRRRDPAGGVVRYDHNDRPQRDVQLAQ